MVLAGVGMEHDALVSVAEKYFGNVKPSWNEDSRLIAQTKGPDQSMAQYTGGIIKVSTEDFAPTITS